MTNNTQTRATVQAEMNAGGYTFLTNVDPYADLDAQRTQRLLREGTDVRAADTLGLPRRQTPLSDKEIANYFVSGSRRYLGAKVRVAFGPDGQPLPNMRAVYMFTRFRLGC